MCGRMLAIVCLCCTLVFPAIAQQSVNFSSLTTREGLSSNTVNVILKDRYGFMWFGTEDGLNKFDGVHFTIYRNKPGDSTTLQSNEILSLHEDQSGNLWIGTGGGSLSLYNRRKDEFSTFAANGVSGALHNNVIMGVCSDFRGKIWVANYVGIDVLDPQTRNVSPVLSATGRPDTNFSKSSICLVEDRQRRMWIGSFKGLYCYNPQTRTTTKYLHSNDITSISGDHINTMVEDKQGNLWIGTNGGLSKLDYGKTSFQNFYSDPNEKYGDNGVNAIAVNDDKIWLGTNNGIKIVDTKTLQVTKFGLDYRNLHGLTSAAIRCVYADKQGICWLGTNRGGINKYDRNLNLFNYVRSNSFDEKGLNYPVVTAFAEGSNGEVFVGTEGNGLSLFEPATRLFKRFNITSSRKGVGNHLSVLSLNMTGKNQLLMGTYGDGFFVIDPATGKTKQMMQGPKINDLNSNEIYCITKTKNGNLWLGTNGKGINVVNSKFEVVVRYTPEPREKNDLLLPVNGYIRDIVEDKKGNIWIATHGGGLAVFDPASAKFSVYTTTNSNISNDKVQSLLEDSFGNMWIATFGGGLNLVSNNSRKFELLSEKEGLPNSAVYKIVDDHTGLIWVSTNKGISSIDIKTKKIRNYNVHNGVQDNNFSRGSGLALTNGTIFFGGYEGFNYFHPASLRNNLNVPPVVITNLRISNLLVKPSADGPITENISVASQITLDYKQNFALDFVALNYTATEQNQYAYKLAGFDKDWNYVGNITTATYTNLDPGDYIFYVKASNNDGVWNDQGTSIKVRVRPPFWRTIYAYCFYLLVAVGFVLYLRHRGIKKLKRNFAEEQKKIFAEQERREVERTLELDRMKIKFLTNLSHDFRTPISLILGPVDSLLAKENNEQSARQLNIIKRNARRLLNLVNQLLDFRKMEEHELKFNPTEGELVKFTREVADSFKDLAERKKIEFSFISGADYLHAIFDHDKLERILFNLLSNAFKFTPANGCVKLELQIADTSEADARTWVNLKVTDTGIGIPEDKKEKVFELFFQNPTETSILNQGSGIGLSITKEFVKMHGGTISVESKQQVGATFNIQLPVSTIKPAKVLAPLSAEVEDLSAEPEVESPPTDDLIQRKEMPVVLLVEDNDDFRFYLKDNLRLQYKVVEASNGKEGWQKALAAHPQLIVSDINMPEMDGIDLCAKIKSDKRTTHIPIILLTALTGDENHLKGLKTGANDYITKPFNVELLNAKIKNLLLLNATLKRTYTRQIKADVPEIQIQSSDEKFLQTVMSYLEENLTNSQLSVEELSKHVGMSRSSLYSKLLELTGQTPVEYIRSVKLEKALVLLEKSDMNIAQIAYSVGFSTPNYFAKSFKAKYNMLPSEYVNKRKKENGSSAITQQP